MKNQNQYPPTRIIRPPIHQRCGQMSDVEWLNTITTAAMKWRTKPYIVSRWATRRRALQNSPDARTSTTAAWTAIEASSPLRNFLESLLLRQFWKKYFALPLCTMSKSVPAATSTIMRTTYACITAGGMDAESAANG